MTPAFQMKKVIIHYVKCDVKSTVTKYFFTNSMPGNKAKPILKQLKNMQTFKTSSCRHLLNDAHLLASNEEVTKKMSYLITQFFGSLKLSHRTHQQLRIQKSL